MLSDCILKRRKYPKLSEDEYHSLCGFLFPYSKNVLNTNIPAIELIYNPKNSLSLIIKNDLAEVYLEALNSTKFFGEHMYIKEDELENLFYYMILIEPTVKTFLNSLNYLRENIEKEIDKIFNENMDNLSYSIAEFYQNNREETIEYFQNTSPVKNLFCKVREKANYLKDLSITEKLQFNRKEYLKFISN